MNVPNKLKRESCSFTIPIGLHNRWRMVPDDNCLGQRLRWNTILFLISSKIGTSHQFVRGIGKFRCQSYDSSSYGPL